MIETFLDLLKANPLLAGGIGTVAFSSVVYFLRSLPMSLYRTVKRMTTIEVFLTSEMPLYHEIVRVLSESRIGFLARNYSTDREGKIIAGFGESVSKYRGRFIVFSRELKEVKLQVLEQMKMTILSRDLGVLHALIAEASTPPQEDIVKVYSTSGGWFGNPSPRRRRSLDTIFCNGAIKQVIIDKIAWFQANEDWYTRRGIPYKLVFLFTGPPGTGKSSLIFGIASYFGRHLASLQSVRCADEALRNLPGNSFAVIEDIDMISVARESGDNQTASSGGAPAPTPIAKAPDQTDQYFGMSSLQVLINTLDGLSTPHGLIVFITTNHKDKLDHALIRKGRIDHEVAMGPLDREATAAMFKAFYGDEHDVYLTEHFKPRTGAELQLLFMTHDARGAFANLVGAREAEIVDLKAHAHHA